MTLPTPPAIAPIVPEDAAEFDLAVILDNTVYQVISTTGQSAAIFLAGPTFAQVDRAVVAVGDAYDPATGAFTTTPNSQPLTA